MKHTRLLFTCLFAFALFATVPAFAQGGGGGNMMAQQSPADWAKTRATSIQTQLSLSDADAQKLIAPLTTYRESLMKAMTAAQSSGAQMTADDRAKMSDQLKKDLVAAGFAADVADKIVAAATQGGRGRRGGGF